MRYESHGVVEMTAIWRGLVQTEARHTVDLLL